MQFENDSNKFSDKNSNRNKSENDEPNVIILNDNSLQIQEHDFFEPGQNCPTVQTFGKNSESKNDAMQSINSSMANSADQTPCLDLTNK